jgi:hypothetical protein
VEDIFKMGGASQNVRCMQILYFSPRSVFICILSFALDVIRVCDIKIHHMSMNFFIEHHRSKLFVWPRVE